MGSYSVLTVDRVHFEWKYEVPTFLTFLFDDDDYYCAIPPNPEDADHSSHWVGYRTTVAEARDRLNELGFTRGFFGGIYETIGDDIDKSLRQEVASNLVHDDGASPEEFWPAAQAAADEYLRSAAELPVAEQLQAFADELRDALAAQPPPAFVTVLPKTGSGEGQLLSIDIEDMSMNLLERFHDIHPAALRVADLFASWSDCPLEIRELFLARLLLDIVPDDAVVDLDLTDFWEGDDWAGHPSRLAVQLVRRIQLYNRAFSVLVEHEDDVRRRAALVRVRELLNSLPGAATNQEKGRLLEDLVAAIFEAEPGFIVAERRYGLGDQEIDLVIRNHVENPFWAALGSPLILVECKNWSAPVGTIEIREFETKLRDHAIARLGFFIAINGFSDEVATALTRAGREPYRLIPLTGADIEELVNEGLGVIEWLTRKISALT